MKITWVTRSFLDYRLPVYEALDRLCGGQLSVVYYSGVVPRHCQERLKEILGDRAIGLSGEVRLSGKKQQPLSQIRGNGLRIPLQPGLVKVLRSTQPDLILADGFFQWTYGALWMRLFHGIPLVMCYEGTRHTERNAGFLRTGYRRLAAKAIDRIVCNGSLSREYIEQLGFPKEKIRIGNMAADIQRFEAQALQPSQSAREALRQQLGVEGKILLFVGRLVPVKGLDKLLEGWKRAFGAGQGATLLIVGEGPQKKELQAYCRANRLGNVRFAGAVDHQEIPTYFSLADVFIIPTLQDNWSLVVPEAMACGLPIASSLYNGCWPELVYGENGWVFDPLDPENLVHTLKQIMADADRWEAMGQDSLNRVREHSPKKIAEGLYESCKSLKTQK